MAAPFGAPTLDPTIPNPFGEPYNNAALDEIEARSGIWTASRILQAIAAIAADLDVNAWALLALFQQHQASRIDPTHVLVDKNGKPGTTLVGGTSLSGFVGLVDETGEGKSALFRTALDLVRPETTPIPDGTGQGIVKKIAKVVEMKNDDDGNPLPEPIDVLKFKRHTVMIHAPEIKSLTAEMVRQGTKTSTMLRSMWVGETVGMTNSDSQRDVGLPPNTYRIHGAWGVHPASFTPILAEAGDGTPQRWLMAPAGEFRRVQRAPMPNGVVFPLPLPVWGNTTSPYGTSGGQLPTVMKDGDEREIAPTWITWNSSPLMQQWIADINARRHNLKDQMNGPFDDVTPELEAQLHAARMESHLMLSTIKTATWMAWLHGDPEPTDQWFTLALAQMEVSKMTLAGCWKSALKEQEKQARRAASEKGTQLHLTDMYKDASQQGEVSAFADELWQKLKNRPMAWRELQHGFSKRRRAMLKEALDRLESRGLLAVDGNNLNWALWQGTPLPYDLANQFKTE